MTRSFVGELVKRLLPDPEIRVQAPICVDVTLRRRGKTVFVHLVNRASGIPNQINNGAIDEIPPLGPITVRMRLKAKPRQVVWALEDGAVDWQWADGALVARIPAVHIHGALVVEI
jgi:hypothetical protein